MQWCPKLDLLHLGVTIRWNGLLDSPIYHKKQVVKLTQRAIVTYPGSLTCACAGCPGCVYYY